MRERVYMHLKIRRAVTWFCTGSKFCSVSDYWNEGRVEVQFTVPDVRSDWSDTYNATYGIHLKAILRLSPFIFGNNRCKLELENYSSLIGFEVQQRQFIFNLKAELLTTKLLWIM